MLLILIQIRALTQPCLVKWMSFQDMMVRRFRMCHNIYVEDAEERRGLTQRYFSKVEKGSLRGSILGMTCAAIGSGVLTFP